MKTEIGSFEWKNEKLNLEIEINQFNLRCWFSRPTDKESWKEHRTNLKKLEAMKKRESEKWRENFA